MKQHKWHKEIKAWADGAEIEHKWIGEKDWSDAKNPAWTKNDIDFRIKPHPKEPQYLYCFVQTGDDTVRQSLSMLPRYKNEILIGKIPLIVESDDD